jgi:hypothetical protein
MEKPSKKCLKNLKKPSKNRIGVLVVSFLIIFNSFFELRSLNAYNNNTFPDFQLKEMSNFKTFGNDIFQIVAHRMGFEINENMPKPIILTDKQITLQKFNSYLGWDSNEVIPYYFSKNNTIVIPLYCKLDSLAHEFVHYFQTMYRNENLNSTNGVDADSLEFEAVRIQKWFKAKYMKTSAYRYI